jgi:hypothetical protein
MADPGCFTENCFFTGTNAQSNAWAGPCTGTAGYLSDAEIKQIIADPARVNQQYVDDTSQTNVLVFDNGQWVGYMSPEIKSSRQNLYQGMNMGGTTDWATDLEDFNDVPPPSTSWESLKLSVQSGQDPAEVGPRNGNWTTISCDDPSVTNLRVLTAGERWSQMDASDAWTDAVNVWKTVDKGHRTFTASISDTLHGPTNADCGNLLGTSNCDQTLQCDGFIGKGSGAAGYAVWNSLVIIHEVCPFKLDVALSSGQTKGGLTTYRCSNPITTVCFKPPPFPLPLHSKTLRISLHRYLRLPIPLGSKYS